MTHWTCDARKSESAASDYAKICASSQAAHLLDGDVYVCATTKNLSWTLMMSQMWNER